MMVISDLDTTSPLTIVIRFLFWTEWGVGRTRSCSPLTRRLLRLRRFWSPDPLF